MANKKDLLNNNAMKDYIIGKRNQQEEPVSKKEETIKEVVSVDNFNNLQDVTNQYKKEIYNKKPKYRFNLSLDYEIGRYVKNVAWEERKSINKFIEDTLREGMKRYIKRGGNSDKWID